MKEKKGFWIRCRSAITGLFIKHKVADENPDTTIEQKIPKKEKK